MEHKEYHQLLNTVSKLIENKKKDPIYINFGGGNRYIHYT